MSALVNSKPVNFVEPYFVCRKTVFAALKDAVGNAAGTAGMVAAIAMAVFGMIFRKVCMIVWVYVPCTLISFPHTLFPSMSAYCLPALLLMFPPHTLIHTTRCITTAQSKRTNVTSKAKMMAGLSSWTRS